LRALFFGACTIITPLAAQQPASPAPTTVVIVGVEHSAQLVARRYHPGYLRAFLDRARPAAICIERSPDEFARNDWYEFTYEAQHVAVPYARSRNIDLCAIDWIPSRDDERLAFGRIEVLDIPSVRQPSGFQGFLVLDSASISRTFFYADSLPNRREARAFYDRERAPGWRDFPRRLGLYRTFMQAQRVRAAAAAHPGRTVVVVVGSMHKDDIEGVLSGDPAIKIEQPSALGTLDDSEADAALSKLDLSAIASFSLLGVQSRAGRTDKAWVDSVLSRLERSGGITAELRLFRLRRDVLSGTWRGRAAAAAFEALANSVADTARFTFTGVEDQRRLDSYYDPYGNMRMRDRALLEAARELLAVDKSAADAMLRRITSDKWWTPLRRAQLSAYWEREGSS
jgi:hypothetical protein